MVRVFAPVPHRAPKRPRAEPQQCFVAEDDDFGKTRFAKEALLANSSVTEAEVELESDLIDALAWMSDRSADQVAAPTVYATFCVTLFLLPGDCRSRTGNLRDRASRPVLA